MSDPVFALDELGDVKNVAIVALEVRLPENGVREGDRLDVYVTSIGAAKSLAGGRLLPCPLQGPSREVKLNFAFASGPIHLPDSAVPTFGVIRGGAVMEQNVIHNYVASGSDLPYSHAWIRPQADYVTLVINDEQASWAMAHTIAQMINEDAAAADQPLSLALAIDPKNVLVEVPTHDRQQVAAVIAGIETLDLFPPRGEARVLIDRKAEMVVITGDVEILPAIISYRDLTIHTGPPQAPDPEAPPEPAATESRSAWVPLDPQRRGKTKLAELVQALEQLRVPARDQIEIVERLHRSGKLLGKLVVEE
jgi:flagellar P-ring protein precursor FlgI